MDYDAVLLQVLELLQREKRLSYRVLKRRFSLDAVDEDGRVLVWSGSAEAMPAPPSLSGRAPDQTPVTSTPQYLTEKILASRAALEGERKQVTILFADIKDSTELIKDLAPEVAQQLLDPALHRMMEAVHRYEGTVNQVLGDGIMALFGAPIAHEDHAIRACYAALAMQAAMREYTEEVRRVHGLEMRIRVGLNSGEVVVRAIGNDLHMDYSAVGQTTHLAARMEQLAVPGSIRLAGATLRLVEGLVQANPLGPVPVKGLAQPVEVFELVGDSAIRRRLQAAAARGLTRFVGREREIEALGQALCRLPLSEAQLLTGRLEEAHALRLLGTIAARRDPSHVEDAEAHYREALALAEELGMRPLVAHCHHGLGILYAKSGRHEQARAELATAIELYRTMEMTYWLPQAEALLAQIGAAGPTGRV